MRRIDEIYLQRPFYGSRKLCESLRDEGTVVNRKHLQRLMRLTRLESAAPSQTTPHSRGAERRKRATCRMSKAFRAYYGQARSLIDAAK